jgi:hypothetical protein
MANGWTELSAAQDLCLDAALKLLKSTLAEYNHLNVALLKSKMTRPTNTPNNLLGSHVYSYADTSNQGNLLKPLASAFFFLRQVHRPKGTKNEDPAFCMSVGADSSLGLNELKQALVDVCTTMRASNTSAPPNVANLEIMHTIPRPKFQAAGTNLELAYNAFITAPKAPKLESKGKAIDVVFPWTDKGATTNLTWWNIKEA